MAVFGGATTLGSVSFSSHLFDQQSCFLSCPLRLLPSSSSSSSSPSHRTPLLCIVKSFSSSSATADTDQSASNSLLRDDDGNAGPSDWKIAKAYCKSGETFEGEVESFNGGGLLIRFHSLLGFLPYPQLSPSRSCKEPQKSIHEIAKTLVGSKLPVKIVQADEENRKLILSEKLALWPKYSQNVSVGDIFTGRVGSVEDYGAFIHLRFDDGLYHLTGLVHVSEVSWDYVQDVRDVLRDGDEVRVIVTNIDKEKSRITLSIKQLEDDPLLETLDKVILKDSSTGSPSLSSNNGDTIEPLPGLETILEELLKEDGEKEKVRKKKRNQREREEKGRKEEGGQKRRGLGEVSFDLSNLRERRDLGPAEVASKIVVWCEIGSARNFEGSSVAVKGGFQSGFRCKESLSWWCCLLEFVC